MVWHHICVVPLLFVPTRFHEKQESPISSIASCPPGKSYRHLRGVEGVCRVRGGCAGVYVDRVTGCVERVCHVLPGNHIVA